LLIACPRGDWTTQLEARWTAVAASATAQLTAIQDIAGITSVSVTFRKAGDTKTFAWTPLDVENAYILFRE
jgi:hypothetical protein